MKRSWQKGESLLKITVEMKENGDVAVESSEDTIDVSAAVLLFELAKLQLMTELMRVIEEDKATPEVEDEIPL